MVQRDNAAVKKEVLTNGLRVITEEIPYVRSVSIGFWIGVGSRSETTAGNGISHFIEHLLFKGTASRTARDIARTIDSIGGQLNAYTSKEYTCLYARVLDDHFTLTFELLADLLVNSRFESGDVDREKAIILEEISMYEDSPEDLVFDLLGETVWQHHSLGWPIIGRRGVIQDLGRENLLEHFGRFYTPENLVVAVAGNVTHHQAVAAVESALGGSAARRAPAPGAAPVFSQGAALKVKDIEQTHLCLGMPGKPMGDQDQYILLLLNSILGGGTSSRLFQKIREEHALAYSVYSFMSAYRDTGLFGVYAATSPGRAEEALGIILKECALLRDAGVTADELNINKEQLKGSLMLGLESTGNRMSRLGKSELFLEKILSPDEITARIDAVTVEDIAAMAAAVLQPQKAAFAAVTPAGGVEKLVDAWPDRAASGLGPAAGRDHR